MYKLLHERLRENGWTDDTSSADEIADEIERDYIPRASCSISLLPYQEHGEAHNKGLVAAEAKLADTWHAGYKRGYNDAAKEPKAWYVLDKNGKPVHIGDRARNQSWYGASDSEKVIALGENEIQCNGYGAPANTCEKVEPNPWEDLRSKLVHVMAAKQWGGKTCGEVAQGIIDEARTIAAQELAQNCNTTEDFLKATGNE